MSEENRSDASALSPEPPPSVPEEGFSPPPVPPEPENPFVPMPGSIGMGALLDTLLKQPGHVICELDGNRRRQVLGMLFGIAGLAFLVYGFLVGWFSGGRQLWAAPVKIAVGALCSGLLCLPSLYIFSCLSGIEVRFSYAFGLLTGLLALTAVLLMGFAPVAWLFSVSTDSIMFMGLLHYGFWGLGTYFGMRFLSKGYERDVTAASGYLTVWMVVYILVTVQMTTTLRPIIGEADTFLPTEKKFFLDHWLTLDGSMGDRGQK